MKKISCIFGTRPEAIKMAPVVLACRESGRLKVEVCVTAQHRQMLDQVLPVFGIRPEVDLDLMEQGQTLAGFTARAVKTLDAYLEASRPDLLLVQGDTTTAFCGALAGFYQQIPVGHVEAGLRTGNISSPWPEEANRRMVSVLAALHFAPTESSRRNLLGEGIGPGRILVTGNTVVDALLMAREKIRHRPPVVDGLPPRLQPGTPAGGDRMVLITGHRRENFGRGFESICQAIRALALRWPDVSFVYPVHLNPNVRDPVMGILGRGAAEDAGGACLPNVHLIEPLSYLPFVAMMDRASLILTDSGGVQEEAPSLGKRVVVMRDTTERQEAVAAGTARLVGTDPAAVESEVSRLLQDPGLCDPSSAPPNPYGDGMAAGRILAGILDFLKN
jgi:UDP-N-acetylglucosamine 2-epimerase (non-hydrolysing)